MKHLSQHTADYYRYALSCQEYLDKKSFLMESLILKKKFRLVISLQFVLTDSDSAEMEDR